MSILSEQRDPGDRACLLVGCLTSRQHASVSQVRICSDKFTCCHTEIEVADQTFYLTQSQYTSERSEGSAVSILSEQRDPGDRACLLVGCLTSRQHASVSQVRICSDKFTCCHTEIEVADQTFYLTQSQYTDTGPACPSADPLTPGAWQGSHWSANFKSLV